MFDRYFSYSLANVSAFLFEPCVAQAGLGCLSSCLRHWNAGITGVLPHPLSRCWIWFLTFLPCKYFSVFKIIWFQSRRIQGFLSCLYCNTHILLLSKEPLSNMSTAHMKMQVCLHRTLDLVLRNSVRQHWFVFLSEQTWVLIFIEVQVLGTVFYARFPSPFWRQVPPVFVKSQTFSMENVCTEFQGENSYRFT